MKTSNRLTTLQLPALLKKPGRHRDGDGLILLVRDSGAAFWVLRYMLGGKARELGLGPLRLVNLAEARQRARDARQSLLDKRDPVEIKHAALQARRLEERRSITFREAVDRFMAESKRIADLKNDKHRKQWRSTLEQASAELGKLPLQEIDSALVLNVLSPILSKTTETGLRLRARIAAVFDWATPLKLFTGENPAKLAPLKSHIPARAKAKHHAAMPYLDLPQFMARLRQRDSVSARAVEVTILCATRTSETVKATWSEFDLDGAVWSIPGSRTKTKKPLRVPLSDRALELLRDAREAGLPGTHVFINREGRPLSNMAMLELLKGMGANCTTHGFRSSFRDWAGDRTAYARDVIELALGHAIENKSEAAYRRGDALDKRRRLMNEWARYLEAPAAVGDNVTALRRA